MKGLVSVIIPVYNREKTLKQCVESVIAQTYKNFEIILIDDGSQDNSLKICKELQESDKRIKVFSTEHIGVSEARNKGLDKAQGEYVFFVDSDDAIHPYYLEDLCLAMEKDGSQMASCKIITIGERRWEECISANMANTAKSETLFKTNEETVDDLFLGRSTFQQIGGVIMKRELIGETRFKSDLFIGEDFYFIYQNLIKGATCTYLFPQRYYARFHSSNISKNKGYSGFFTRFYRRQLVWENEEKLGRFKYANIQKRDAFSCFLRCIRHNKPYSNDAVKMRKTLKAFRKKIFPALSCKLKILMCLAIYFPLTFSVMLKYQMKSLKKRRHKKSLK